MAVARYPLFGMPKPARPPRKKGALQRSTELVDVAAWRKADMEGGGARGGAWLIAPPESPFEFLAPHHAYFLKPPIDRSPSQHWNELIAHRLGTCIGIEVPPTHAAYNSLTREAGALSESFLRPRPSVKETLLSGREVLKLLEGKSKDKRVQRLHNFGAISSWITFLERNRLTNVDWREHWSKAFLLDSLLGNTDRHPDNWGAIAVEGPFGRTLRPAPSYDNGTSMGYEFPEDRLPELVDPSWLMKYVYRGTHQMFWRETDAKRLSHPLFLKRFFNEFPEQRAGIMSRLRIADRTVERIVNELTTFRGPQPLSRQRADFMIRLIKFRRDHLVALLSQRIH
jgi:hypothetical protein